MIKDTCLLLAATQCILSPGLDVLQIDPGRYRLIAQLPAKHINKHTKNKAQNKRTTRQNLSRKIDLKKRI